MTESNTRHSNRNSERDINILLLGETGVGKSTFINAVFNYLTYDTLDEALDGKMQIVIPSAFSIADNETYTPETIQVGSADDNELCQDNGQSQTQGCKSYTFSINNRYIRLIDTPGIGDCRGVEQDEINFNHILSFLHQFEHLNAICILLKPNENRLNIFFKYGIIELLKHINTSAKDNIMFVFTYGQSTFFEPGATARQLKILLNGLEEKNNIAILFSKANTFMFDNEGFRFLAVRKNEKKYYETHKSRFIESWKKSVAELQRLLECVSKCSLHAVRDMQSLNEARQLIRQLARPIGEISTLLQENIQLAEKHKSRILNNETDISTNRIPEKIAEIIRLKNPRTICASGTCSKRVEISGETRIDCNVPCHDRCSLQGVEQEVINNPIMKKCRAIDRSTGKCKRCGCDWTSHMHVTYEFRKQLRYFKIENLESSRTANRMLSLIDERIAQLTQEQEIVCHIAAKLTVFLRNNSISSTNENVVEYIKYFIQERKDRRSLDENNPEVIRGLEKLLKDYENEIKSIKSNPYEEDDLDQTYLPKVDDIFVYETQLCELYITGKYIRQQIEALKLNETYSTANREKHFDLLPTATSSKIIKDITKVIK